jgi:hypothetical protein
VNAGRIGASVAVAAVAVVPVSLVGLAPVWYAAVVLTAGGLAYLILLLVDVQRRLAALGSDLSGYALTTGRLIEDGFSKVSEATELFGTVEAAALRTDMMTQLVRRAVEISPTPSLVYDLAQTEIARVSEFLGELAEGGDVTYDGEDRDWLLGLTRSAEATIDAISLHAVDGGGGDGLWATDLGQRYLEAQREAVARGTRVRRIFVVDRADPVGDPDFASLVGRQRALGIQVRLLDGTAMPETRRTSLFDFIVFDGVLSYEVMPASGTAGESGAVILNTRLVLEEHRVSECVQRFNDLWESSVEPGG